MALPGRVRDFLHDHSVEIGIFAAVAVGFLEALVVLAALNTLENARSILGVAPLWVWAIPPAIAGFLAWLKLHDLPPSDEVQELMDDERRASAQFARAERIRNAIKRER
jgi:hypothetical protein